MAFDGNGNWISNFSAEADKAAGYKILASRFDNIFIADIAQSFENCLTKDAQVKPTTNFDVNNNRVINMADPVNNLDAVNKQTLVSSDALCVHLAGTETITGDKTFSGAVGLGSSATATTQASTDDSTKVATTAFVQDVASSYAYGATPRDITELADGQYTTVTSSTVFNLSEPFTNFEELVVIGVFSGASKTRGVAYRISTYWLNEMLTEMQSVELWGCGGGDFVDISGYNASTEQSTTTQFKVRGQSYAQIGKIYGVNRKQTP